MQSGSGQNQIEVITFPPGRDDYGSGYANLKQYIGIIDAMYVDVRNSFHTVQSLYNELNLDTFDIFGYYSVPKANTVYFCK